MNDDYFDCTDSTPGAHSTLGDAYRVFAAANDDTVISFTDKAFSIQEGVIAEIKRDDPTDPIATRLVISSSQYERIAKTAAVYSLAELLAFFDNAICEYGSQTVISASSRGSEWLDDPSTLSLFFSPDDNTVFFDGKIHDYSDPPKRRPRVFF